MEQTFILPKTAEPGTVSDQIRILTAEKINLFEQYREVTLKLKLGIQEENDFKVKALLKKRHKIINCIEGIDRSMNATAPDHTGQSHVRVKAGGEDELRDLLKNISMIEKECIVSVEVERNKIKQAILDQRTNRKRQMQYENPGSATAKFINTQIR